MGNKILIINLQRSGDIFQSFQVIFALKKKYPNIKIYYLTNSLHSSALTIVSNYIEKIFIVDYLYIFDKLSSKDFASAFLYLKNFIININNENLTTLINLNFSLLSSIFSKAIKSNRKIGAILRNSSEIIITEHYLKNLFLNIENKNFRQNIVEVYLLSLNLQYPKAFFFPTTSQKDNTLKVIIHQGASKKEKQWGMKNYFHLCNKIYKKNKNVKFYLTGGKGDIKDNKNLATLLKETDIYIEDYTNKLSYNALLHLLSNSDWLVSGDTSIQHIAAFTPIKSIDIFLGNAYHYHTFPYSINKFVIFPQISCYPCNANYNCNHQKCKETVTVDMVLSIIFNEEKFNNIYKTVLKDNSIKLEKWNTL